MRGLKAISIVITSLILTLMLGSAAGCGEHRTVETRTYYERDTGRDHVDRHEDRRDIDRHEVERHEEHHEESGHD